LTATHQRLYANQNPVLEKMRIGTVPKASRELLSRSWLKN